MSERTERVLRVVMALGLAALAVGIFRSFREEIVEVGETAPEFSIITDSGRRVSRSDFGGRLLVLNFWATWCQPCLEEIPSLSELQKEFAGEGVVVLGVSVDLNEAAYRRVVAQKKVAFLTARDPEAGISARYGTFKYPETYLIDGRGKVVQKVIGPANWTDAAVKNQIKALLKS
jgi:peroxiredoxin